MPPSRETLDALVLGAGISGLAAARALARAGWTVRVIEEREAPGGTIRTAESAGFRVELGPNTVQDSPELRELARDANCEDGLVPASPQARRRYLVHRGRLAPLPSGPPGLLRTPLLSAGAKLRLATDPWRSRGPGPQESVAAFFRRRLGPGVERLADAMVLGIYAGDPEELAVGYAFRRVHALERDHGSLFAGLRRSAGARPPGLVSFQGGLATFADRLTKGLEVETGCRATEIRREGDAFRVTVARGDERRELTASRLVTALPASSTARLLSPLGSTQAIAGIPHAPVAVVALGYERARVSHPLDGFGFLAPHPEGRDILGCIFTSTLFPATAPEGHVLLTAMVGGRRRPGLVDLDDDALQSKAHCELVQLLGIEGGPVFRKVTRWQPGIPQPTSHQTAVIEEAAVLERAHPGLKVLGNWLHGVGVPDCIRAGWGVR